MHFSRGFSPAISMAIGLGIASAWSQTAQAPDTAFDVASIKPARPDARGYSIRPFPGRLSAENVTLKLLIAEAYHVYDFQISGPKWMDSDRYDLEAKIAGDAPPSKTQLRAMLQRLLADRFGLSVRRESKEMSVYMLEAGTCRAADRRCETRRIQGSASEAPRLPRDVPGVPAAADNGRECSAGKFDGRIDVVAWEASAGSDRAGGVVRL